MIFKQQQSQLEGVELIEEENDLIKSQLAAYLPSYSF